MDIRESLRKGGWSVGIAWVFSQSASVTGSAIEVCIVSGGDGSITIGYAWQEGVVESHLVQQLMGDCPTANSKSIKLCVE